MRVGHERDVTGDDGQPAGLTRLHQGALVDVARPVPQRVTYSRWHGFSFRFRRLLAEADGEARTPNIRVRRGHLPIAPPNGLEPSTFASTGRCSSH